jgi:hypothetical protein
MERNRLASTEFYVLMPYTRANNEGKTLLYASPAYYLKKSKI